MNPMPGSIVATPRGPADTRRRRRRLGAAPLTIAAIAVAAICADAASLSRTATATASVNATAKLTLSSTSLAFPDADPDTTPAIPALGGALTITAKARTTIGDTVTLVVQAGDDLLSGLDRILATQLTWTATGAGFVAGTMSKTAAQTVASWTSSGAWVGTQLAKRLA